MKFSLGSVEGEVRGRLRRWQEDRLAFRLWAKDHTLWVADEVPELADRLGWLHLPARMRLQAHSLQGFADEVRSAGIRRVVLLGMGGSSLAPEVYQRIFGNAAGFPSLAVLDTTHPAAVRAAATGIDPERTLFVVSSKSGGTVETLALFRYFWALAEGALPEPGRHFVAITDPGSCLEAMARERQFREIFGAPPDVGGRYSALSVFGLVPAALIGVDVERLLEEALATAVTCAEVEGNPGLALGAALCELAAAGHDKLTFVTSPSMASFPDWIEQLVAESTGKEGGGIVPVVGEPLAAPDRYGEDRVFVELGVAGEEDSSRAEALAALEAAGHPTLRCILGDRHALGSEMFRWQVAVAVAATARGINPFDQPDVQLAKDLARRAMASDPVPDGDRAGVVSPAAIPAWLEQADPGDYVAVQAFIAPSPEATQRLRELQGVIRDRTRVATTVGHGPRFLHSTGQLHKGGPATGLYLQLVDDPGVHEPVPKTEYDFGRLITAQAAGDLQALRERQRRVVRVDLGKDAGSALSAVVEALR